MEKRSTHRAEDRAERPVLVLVSGGSASGKSTLVAEAERYLRRRLLVLGQDSYYCDRRHMSLKERDKVNFDEPAAFDWPLLRQHLARLRRGEAVTVPVYSYKLHTRVDGGSRVEARPVVLVEGLFPAHDAAIRRMADLQVFVDLESDERLIRRLRRDVRERGRSAESVIRQYLETVKPMHNRWVEPCRAHAHLVLSGMDSRAAARDLAKAVTASLRRRSSCRSRRL